MTEDTTKHTPSPLVRQSVADELRAAAKVLRETAAAWTAYVADHAKTGGWYEPGHLAEALHIHVGSPDAEADAAWIALMSPAVAEPLAAWFEKTADSLEAHAHGAWHEVLAPDALAIARAIKPPADTRIHS